MVKVCVKAVINLTNMSFNTPYNQFQRFMLQYASEKYLESL